MSKALYHLVFIPAVLAGLFMGVYLKTGTSIEPTDLTLAVGDAAADQVGGVSKNVWDGIKTWILIGSFVVVFFDVFFILMAGLPSIIAAVGGYFGMLLISIGFLVELGVLMLIVGEVVSLLAPQPARR